MSEKHWSHSEGERPFTVTVFERRPGGVLYVRAWDPSARGNKGNWSRVSLGHRDKVRAKRYAREQARKLEAGQVAEAKVSLSEVFAAYLSHRSPRKAKSEQQADARRAELWTRVLGNIDPHNVSSARWDGFITARTSGAIDARGNATREEAKGGPSPLS
jgi:hypothetical protein